MKNRKVDFISRGTDKWKIEFINSPDIPCIVVHLMRPSPKWYQSEYLYSDYTYSRDPSCFYYRADRLIDKYYREKQRIADLDNFFANT